MSSEVTNVDDSARVREEAENGDPEILIYALSGGGGTRTMRVQGMANNNSVSILIDSGSTHNFINKDVAARLNLIVTPIVPFEARVASGDRLVCSECYDDVHMNIQGYKFCTTLFALPITRLNIVLGL